MPVWKFLQRCIALSNRIPKESLKALFHPACLARVVSWFAFVVAIFMGHENGDKQRETKSRHVQGMLDETEPLKIRNKKNAIHHGKKFLAAMLSVIVH